MLPFLQRVKERYFDNAVHGVSNTLVPYQYPDGYPGGSYLPLLLIGEAPGADEERQGVPFVGASGQLLDKWLKASGLPRGKIPVLNTFRYRPQGNDVQRFFAPLGDAVEVCEDLKPRGSNYLRRHFRGEIDHLKATILDYRPEAIVTLGATALWAITNYDMPIARVTADRPDQMCTLEHGGRYHRFTLFAAYHPSAVLRGGTQYESTSLRALKAAARFVRPAS